MINRNNMLLSHYIVRNKENAQLETVSYAFSFFTTL